MISEINYTLQQFQDHLCSKHLNFIYKNSTPEQSPPTINCSNQNLIKQQTYTCRICLDSCLNIQFCLCKNNLLCHQECLIKYLNKKILKSRTKLPYCQICKFRYLINFQVQCKFSFAKIFQKLLQNPHKCLFYLLFYIITGIFYGIMGYLIIKQQIKNGIQAVILVLAGFISMLFILFFGGWISQYVVINKRRIKNLSTAQIQVLNETQKLGQKKMNDRKEQKQKYLSVNKNIKNVSVLNLMKQEKSKKIMKEGNKMRNKG